MKPEHKAFYRDVLDNLKANSLAIFAGAGLSKSAGFVDWKGLLQEIAEDLGLNIELEHDLISIAQYNENKFKGKSVLNQKIIEEFNQDVDLTDAHKILARLPIYTYWTTNYDDLIERSLKNAKRVADVKHSISQLSLSKPRRDAIVYKMHGDATLPNDAVLTKEDYERYQTDKAPFVTALSGDLVSKLFIFIGFSFTDPNLDYVLSRVRLYMKGANRHHYFFIKKVELGDAGIKDKAEYEYQKRKQELFVEDLSRYKLQPVYVDTYLEITDILKEIEQQYKKRTVFISGSAEEYGSWDRNKAQEFIHKLSSRLVKENFRIVNGFGWGIGSAIINGALQQIYSNPEKHNENQLIVKPFPQYSSGQKDLPTLWNEYRQNMLEYAGIAIYLFGNKKSPDNPSDIINADGVEKEFIIADSLNLFHIPIKATGYIAEKLASSLKEEDYKIEKDNPLYKTMELLYNEEDSDKIIDLIIKIIKQINH